MASTFEVSRLSTKQPKSSGNASKSNNSRAWWWTDTNLDSDQVASSETELLNAAVLCAALSATQSEPSETDEQATNRATCEIEMHVHKSPLPHSLHLPVLAFSPDYVLMQSEFALLCAVRATKPADILQTVVGSAVPLSQPYLHRYGAARIHAPFWKRTQRLNLQDIHHRARQAKKMLILCGHSIGGSIAQLAFCELAYLHLPTKVRLSLEKRDFEQQKQEQSTENGTRTCDELDFGLMIQGMTEEERSMISRNMPRMLAIGFGSPYIGSSGLTAFLEPLKLSKRVITFVNEFDCIPSILNVAQSAAMVAKTTDRFVTIAKATKTLVNLLPIQMQQRFVALTATSNTGTVPNASSAYLSMSLNILQNTFQKFRDYNIVKEIDYQYFPCGTYIFLSKSGTEYSIYSDPSAISKALHKEDDFNSTLTGNAILQHLMSAYVSAVARRSNSIQINASMDFYERLNIPRNATEKEIRSAYKRLALKWHPDRWANNSANPQELASAEEIFKLLAESYEVLSDTEARKAYDAHLTNSSSSIRDEFVRNGTVNGMTLDEAIATFRDVIDNLSGAVSKVTSRFSTSNSTVVNPLRTPSSVRSGLNPNNHDNIFAPDRIRVSRTVGIGADQSEQILYLEPEEIIAGDIAAPAQATSSSGGNAGLRTISMVGGAVAVGASVALIVNAWSQYSETLKRNRQAAVVRDMPADCLLLLLEDYRNTQHTDTTQLLIQQADERRKRRDTSSLALSNSSNKANESTGKQLFVRGARQALATLKQEEDAAEDELIEEFFDCATEYDNAVMEAIAEEEFFDCVSLLNDVAVHFSKDALEEEKRVEEGSKEEEDVVGIRMGIAFPRGSIVSTPFGLAIVQDWREGELSADVRFICSKDMVGYIQKANISRGALLAKATASDILESKRTRIADRVIARYHLDAGEAGTTFKSLVIASGDGALDSGIRAAGGVALAKGMARTSSALGGAVAAPLTIASILVDIGKEYYDYRKRYTDRKSLGVLSTTTEQLMMQDFRLKTGEVIASRTAAAAGAGIGAYSVASALGMWSTAGFAAGPVGIVAATSAAVVGGMLGFFAGSKAYSASTAGYFTSQENAKEHIDRLELGARILFDELDPEATGTISKEDCIKLMKKLYDAMGSISESGYERTMIVIHDDAFVGPVTWGMFWEWVSTEAARALRELEHEESKKLSEPVAGEAWWNSYMTYFSYPNSRSATPSLAAPHASVYPSVLAAQGLKMRDTKLSPTVASSEDESLVLKAQVEFLVNNGHLTAGDAFQLREQLASDDLMLKESAQRTIAAMHEGLSDGALNHNLVCDGFGFAGGDVMDASAVESEKERVTTCARASEATATNDDTKRFPEPDERLDVMCSLMSTQGLERLLQRQNILVGNDMPMRHEDLHCLALMAAAPASLTPESSN